MTNEPISDVAIDEVGRLVIRPTNTAFNDLYSAGAWGFRWDEANSTLVSPQPEAWSHCQWFQHIVRVIASQYGVALTPNSDTNWENTPVNVRAEIETFARSNWLDELLREHHAAAGYGRRIEFEQALSHASQLWNAGCYSEYVEELSPHQNQLTPAQLKRFEIAKKRAVSS